MTAAWALRALSAKPASLMWMETAHWTLGQVCLLSVLIAELTNRPQAQLRLASALDCT